MVQKLFELSSHAIRNAVINGEISSICDLPLTLRIWILEVFRMKQLLHHRNVIRVCRQSGFLDGFTSINIDFQNVAKCMKKFTSDATDLCFLAFLASHVNSNRHLAESLIELRLSFTATCLYSCDARQQPVCQVEENILHLLSLCKNLKRLYLIAFQPLVSKLANNGYHSFADSPIRLPPLEHLSVIARGCWWNPGRLPRRWFESIRSLKIHQFHYDFEFYCDILFRCRDTLTALDLEEWTTTEDFILVPIALPELRSLSVVSACSQPIIFEDLVNNCPNLRIANLKIPVYEIFETELVALAQLSDRLQFYLIVSDELENFSEFIQVVGKNIYGISDDVPSFTNRFADQIFSLCTNLRCLDILNMNNEPLIFLQKILNDKEKAAKITELNFEHNFTEEMLMTIFANCCNLRILSLVQRSETMDISSYVKTWIANGAKPTSIDLLFLGIFSVDTVFLLFKASRYDLLSVRVNTPNMEGGYSLWLNFASNYCPFMEDCSVDYCQRAQKDEIAQLINKYDQICFNPKPFYF